MKGRCANSFQIARNHSWYASAVELCVWFPLRFYEFFFPYWHVGCTAAGWLEWFLHGSEVNQVIEILAGPASAGTRDSAARMLPTSFAASWFEGGSGLGTCGSGCVNLETPLPLSLQEKLTKWWIKAEINHCLRILFFFVRKLKTTKQWLIIMSSNLNPERGLSHEL